MAQSGSAWSGFAILTTVACAAGAFGCADDFDCDAAVATPTFEAASCPHFSATPFVAHEVAAANGTFRDHCDANGNLVEYSCDRVCSGTDSHGEPVCDHYGSDQAVEQSVDCGGTCACGVCLSRCPHAGEQVVVAEVSEGGDMQLVNPQSGQRWACYFHSCTYPPAQGETLTLTGPIDPFSLCLPGRPEVIRFTPSCPYDCQLCAYACEAL